MLEEPCSRLKVINLFGAPGMGKSAVAGGLFWLMKSHVMSVEQISEYAKHLVLCGYTEAQLLSSQNEILEKQHHKQVILKGKYDYAVTDSPLPLCSFYAGGPADSAFSREVGDRFNGFENINFFLSRDLSGNAHFEEEGRTQNKRRSIEIEREMLLFLQQRGIPYERLSVAIETPWLILERIAPGIAMLPVFNQRTLRV
jgi:hypothetical protein